VSASFEVAPFSPDQGGSLLQGMQIPGRSILEFPSREG